MSVPMVDCRNLIEFCRAFERHTSNTNPSTNNNTRRLTSANSNFSSHFCRSPFAAAVDLIILLSVVGSLGFLFAPYFTFLFREVLPLFHSFIADLISDAPIAYYVGLVLALLGVVFGVLVWEIVQLRLRRCGNPHCKGLRKAVEYDIQLEPHDCIDHCSRPPNATAYHSQQPELELQLGQDREELEAELKKMAPPNGRTVLIFRAPCGCPAGRLEVWGPKRIRRIKK